MKKVLFGIAVGLLPLCIAQPAISQSLDQQFKNNQSVSEKLKSLCPTRWKNAQYKMYGMDGRAWSSNAVRLFVTKENEVLWVENYNGCNTRTHKDFTFSGVGKCYGPYIIGRQLSGPDNVTCLLKKEGREIVLYRKSPRIAVNREVLYTLR